MKTDNERFYTWLERYRSGGGDDRGYAYPIVKAAFVAGGERSESDATRNERNRSHGDDDNREAR